MFHSAVIVDKLVAEVLGRITRHALKKTDIGIAGFKPKPFSDRGDRIVVPHQDIQRTGNARSVDKMNRRMVGLLFKQTNKVRFGNERSLCQIVQRDVVRVMFLNVFQRQLNDGGVMLGRLFFRYRLAFLLVENSRRESFQLQKEFVEI